MIITKGITKSYGVLKVLKGIDFQVEKGEIVSIYGASGAGKTTFLQILGTLDIPDEGEIIYDNINIKSLKERHLSRFRNKHIGFVFQLHYLLPEFTALENVCIPAFIDGISRKEAERQALKLLDDLNLADRVNHKPSELSGGEQQRVAVARALINHPEVLLADEPSGNLDSKNKKELHKLLLRIHDEMKQTIVIVTHDKELSAIAYRRLLMKDGKLFDT